MPLENNSKESKHIPELDGVRGIAIAMVLMYHYFYIRAVVAPGNLVWHLLAPLRIGWTGVDLFFVLSGFLIGGILLDARTSSNYFKTFYARRFYRIVPLYILIVCASYVFWVVLDRGYSPQFQWMLHHRVPWISYVFYMQNFWMAATSTFGFPVLGGTWSLAIEEQFYLTLPLLIWILEPRQLRRLLITAVIAAPVIRVCSYLLWPDDYLMRYVLMPCRADSLLLGVLAAMAMRDATCCVWLETRGRQVVGTIWVLLLGCALSIHYGSSLDSRLMQTVGYTWMALLYAVVILYALTQRTSVVSRILRWNSLRRLGKIAYGVYLLHGVTLILAAGWLLPGHPMRSGWPALDSWSQLGFTIVVLILTLGFCQVSWRYFEKPLVQMGHRWKYENNPILQSPADNRVLSPQ